MSRVLLRAFCVLRARPTERNPVKGNESNLQLYRGKVAGAYCINDDHFAALDVRGDGPLDSMAARLGQFLQAPLLRNALWRRLA